MWEPQERPSVAVLGMKMTHLQMPSVLRGLFGSRWGGARQLGSARTPRQGPRKPGFQFCVPYCHRETSGKCFPLRASVCLSGEWVR